MSEIRHRWTFDELFSTYASQGLDTDGDGEYSREELQPLAQVNVESLSEFEFFTFAGVEEANVAFMPPKDYWLDFDGKQLTLNYTLPLDLPFDPKGNGLIVEIYDPEFFVDFALADGHPVRLVDAPDSCRLKVDKPVPLDGLVAMELMEVGPEQRSLPEELQSYVEGRANTIRINCG